MKLNLQKPIVRRNFPETKVRYLGKATGTLGYATFAFAESISKDGEEIVVLGEYEVDKCYKNPSIKREGWIIVANRPYNTQDAVVWFPTTQAYLSKEDALNRNSAFAQRGTLVRIEWEVNE